MSCEHTIIYIQGDDLEGSKDNKADAREKAACTVTIGKHSIRHYHATGSSEARFEATCNEDTHAVWDARRMRYVVGRCRVTRHLSANNMKTAASRPLGMMVAWILNADSWTSKEDHCDDLYIKCISWERRAECRELLRKTPNGALLMSFERKKNVGESEEPRDDP